MLQKTKLQVIYFSGVVLDTGMPKAKVSEAVSKAAGLFLQTYPLNLLNTFKWITLNSTQRCSIK